MIKPIPARLVGTSHPLDSSLQDLNERVDPAHEALLKLRGILLDLHWDSGQRALRENGLEEAFKANSRPEGDFYRITDKSANIILETPEDIIFIPEEIRPEIDRNVLRRILLDAVPNSSFKWGHTLSSARPLGNGEHELVFTNGTKVVCDVLIGADGAHSHIRPLVSPVPAQYTGINGAEFSLAPEVVAHDEPFLRACALLIIRHVVLIVPVTFRFSIKDGL